jgi:hypothetical protein
MSGWRGLKAPTIQVHRFVDLALADTVTLLWDRGIENGGVRELLLQLIAAGKLGACAQIAYDVATDSAAQPYERRLASEALQHVQDARIEAVAASVDNDAARWPPAVARRVMVELFPAHMPVDRMKSIIGRVPESGVGDYKYKLPHQTAQVAIAPHYLDALRQALTDLVSDGLSWNGEVYPHLRTLRPDLLPSLAAACCHKLQQAC